MTRLNFVPSLECTPLSVSSPAILVLADGSVFHGLSIGADGTTVGEVVFNTAMSGYQEILTDPSYARQLVTLTYPHIGNYGINLEDIEADRIHAAGLVVRDVPRLHSNFRAHISLPDYLKSQNVVGISDIDTRRLTRILRTTGAQSGCIMAGDVDEATALKDARAFPGLAGMDLARVVSGATAYDWTENVWKLGRGYGQELDGRFHVVAFDYGIKRNILRMLVERGCRLSVLPATATAACGRP